MVLETTTPADLVDHVPGTVMFRTPSTFFPRAQIALISLKTRSSQFVVAAAASTGGVHAHDPPTET